MLPTNLTTNEVKNAAGTEVEFLGYDNPDRGRIFAKSGETPAYPERVKFQHLSTGKGVNKRRRSVMRVDISSLSEVDSLTVITDSVYVVGDFAEGHHTTTTKQGLALAHVIALLASDGSNTTVKFDGTSTAGGFFISGTL